jgi:hypothetical protein
MVAIIEINVLKNPQTVPKILKITASFIFFAEASGVEFFATMVIISETMAKGVNQRARFIIDQTSIPTLSFPSGTGSISI